MDRLQSLKGQMVLAIGFAQTFVEFRFLPPPDDSPVDIELDGLDDASESFEPDASADSYIAPSRTEEAVLRAYTPPRLSTDRLQVQYPEPGSRDALCALLDNLVGDVVLRPGRYIRLTFVEGGQLQIPLRGQEHMAGPAAVLEHHGVGETYW
ncbi:MAG TPA: hypothetical protein VFU01_18780 [Gemmatimonadaceae bacterium]|nr:hypothetical protein [Gemmatimonadaceae bacterium]